MNKVSGPSKSPTKKAIVKRPTPTPFKKAPAATKGGDPFKGKC